MAETQAQPTISDLIKQFEARYWALDREREFYSYLVATVIVNLKHQAPDFQTVPAILEWIEGEVAQHNAGFHRTGSWGEIQLTEEAIIGGLRYEAGTYRIQRIGPPPKDVEF